MSTVFSCRQAVAGRSGEAAGQDTPSSSLGNTIDSVEQIARTLLMDERLKIKGQACNCAQCEFCATHHIGWRRRGWILHCLTHAAFSDGANMVTVTVDRNGTHTGRRWDSPEAAFDYVTKNRIVAELLRHLGIKRQPWISVVEWQCATSDERGDGWPHWHIVLPCYVDLERAAKWLKKKGVCGKAGIGVDQTGIGKGMAETSKKLANYLGGYLTKGGDVGSWVDNRHRIRSISSARNAGLMPYAEYLAQFRESDKQEGIEEEPEEAADGSGQRSKHTIGERKAGCRTRSVAFIEETFADLNEAGEVLRTTTRERFVGRLRCSLRDVRRLAKRKGVKDDIDHLTRADIWAPCLESWQGCDENGEPIFSEWYVQMATVVGVRAVNLPVDFLRHLPREVSKRRAEERLGRKHRASPALLPHEQRVFEVAGQGATSINPRSNHRARDVTQTNSLSRGKQTESAGLRHNPCVVDANLISERSAELTRNASDEGKLFDVGYRFR